MVKSILSGGVLRGLAVSVALVTAPAVACTATGVAAIRLLGAGTTRSSTPDDIVALGVTVALAVALAWLAAAVAAGCVDAVRHLVDARPAPLPRARGRGAVSALACMLVLAAATPAAAAGSLAPPVAPAASLAASPTAPTEGPARTADPAGSLPGAAAPGAARSAGEPGHSTRPAPVPGWVPRVSRTPPTVTALVTAPSTAGEPSPGQAPHVVVEGDTLWDIAARRLGAAATAAEVAADWPRWWRANHRVIGDDPDLLRPGQVLHPPPRAG